MLCSWSNKKKGGGEKMALLCDMYLVKCQSYIHFLSISNVIEETYFQHFLKFALSLYAAWYVCTSKLAVQKIITNEEFQIYGVHTYIYSLYKAQLLISMLQAISVLWALPLVPSCLDIKEIPLCYM